MTIRTELFSSLVKDPKARHLEQLPITHPHLHPSTGARLDTSSKWISYYERTFLHFKTFHLINTLYKYIQFHAELMRKLTNKKRLNWVDQRTYVHSSVATNSTMQSRHRSTLKTERSRDSGSLSGYPPYPSTKTKELDSKAQNYLLQVHQYSMSDLLQVLNIITVEG